MNIRPFFMSVIQIPYPYGGGQGETPANPSSGCRRFPTLLHLHRGLRHLSGSNVVVIAGGVVDVVHFHASRSQTLSVSGWCCAMLCRAQRPGRCHKYVQRKGSKKNPPLKDEGT